MLEERVEVMAVPQRWEYHCERLASLEKLEERLNQFGNDRWELVSLLPRQEHICAVFKRPQKSFSHRPAQSNASSKFSAAYPK